MHGRLPVTTRLFCGPTRRCCLDGISTLSKACFAVWERLREQVIYKTVGDSSPAGGATRVGQISREVPGKDIHIGLQGWRLDVVDIPTPYELVDSKLP